MTADTFTGTPLRPETGGATPCRADINAPVLRAPISRQDADFASVAAPDLAGRGDWTTETVLSVSAWTPNLFTLRTSRDPGFRFTPGQHARLGLARADGTIAWRPYSIASAARHGYLEFLITTLPDSTFARRLARLQAGRQILVERRSYGDLTPDRFVGGKELWMLAGGAGIAPFLSILGDPGAWQRYDRLIVVHSVRQANELACRDEIVALTRGGSPAAGRARLHYVPVVTRDCCPDALSARITRLIADGRLEARAGAAFDRESSRIMICGNLEMAGDLRQLFVSRGFRTDRRGNPGQLAFESY